MVQKQNSSTKKSSRPKLTIATRTGDKGTTGFYLGGRVSKDDLRVETYGTIDELNAALGLARSLIEDQVMKETILDIQQSTFVINSEIACHDKNKGKLENKISDIDVLKIEHLIQKLENNPDVYKGWAIPGSVTAEAALDLARTICRRAERRLVTLQSNDMLKDSSIPMYINRVSDLIWLLARHVQLDAEK